MVIMPAAEIIILTLGGAIAKALLRQYAGDSWFELGKDLLDKLTDQGVKSVEQRNAGLRINSLAARVTRDLSALFDREGAQLTPQRAVLATQLSFTLQQVNINSALLLRYRRKPARLADHLHSFCPDATRHLSELETAFYHRLVYELSRSLLHSTTQLADYEAEFSSPFWITRSRCSPITGFFSSCSSRYSSHSRHKPLCQNPPPALQHPERADHFTGRQDELDQLVPTLQPGQVITLCGPGGVGKTALAAEAVWPLAPGDTPPERFPDGVIFHTFYNQPQVAVALEHIARTLGEEPRPDALEAARRALASRTLLLVLDGAENADICTRYLIYKVVLPS